MAKNYKKTLLACYFGFITQAISANFAPLLFLTFHKSYSIPLSQIALISAVFFFTQLVVDILCVKFANKIGYRNCIVASQLFASFGLAGLAFIPELFANPFIGILICVVIYAIGSGLIEVLCSPIVEACPFEHKEATMSLLHSFYCWGSVAVILLSTIFFYFFGTANWKILSLLWALVPFYNTFNFLTCPIEHPEEEKGGTKAMSLFKLPMFYLAIVLMVCAGASELSMAQWASAFAESALGLTKALGDLLGPCLFAIAMGISRVFYGKYGEKIDLMKYMIASAILCILCYLLVSLSSNSIISLIGCILCGFSVAIMWPGTISLCSIRLPKGGTAMFALLAMAGDLGGSSGPSLVGFATGIAGDNIQKGLLAGIIFPIVLLISLILLGRSTKKAKSLK